MVKQKSKTTAYKVFTHDLRSPIQGGAAVWDGTLPYQLPKVEVDQSSADCAAGWNFCLTAERALQIAGFWPDGYPARLFQVEADEYIQRGNKCRAAELRIVEEVSVSPAIRALSQKWFGAYAEEMYREQMAWYEALGRPLRDRDQVEAGLRRALEVRGLGWKLKQYGDARAAWDAWDAWDAWAAWAAWDAWAARAAWDAWDAWDAWAAWAAWDAWAALIVYFSSLNGWIKHNTDTGLRDGYRNGLVIAIPVEKEVLGWAMK